MDDFCYKRDSTSKSSQMSAPQLHLSDVLCDVPRSCAPIQTNFAAQIHEQTPLVRAGNFQASFTQTQTGPAQACNIQYPAPPVSGSLMESHQRAPKTATDFVSHLQTPSYQPAQHQQPQTQQQQRNFSYTYHHQQHQHTYQLSQPYHGQVSYAQPSSLLVSNSNVDQLGAVQTPPGRHEQWQPNLAIEGNRKYWSNQLSQKTSEQQAEQPLYTASQPAQVTSGWPQSTSAYQPQPQPGSSTYASSYPALVACHQASACPSSGQQIGLQQSYSTSQEFQQQQQTYAAPPADRGAESSRLGFVTQASGGSFAHDKPVTIRASSGVKLSSSSSTKPSVKRAGSRTSGPDGPARWAPQGAKSSSDSSMGGASATTATTTSTTGKDLSPCELENFAERFKQSRIKLGITQADVGKALASLQISGAASLSQSTICRFESLTLSHNNMIALRPILQAWLDLAESQSRQALSSICSTTTLEGQATTTSVVDQQLPSQVSLQSPTELAVPGPGKVTQLQPQEDLVVQAPSQGDQFHLIESGSDKSPQSDSGETKTGKRKGDSSSPLSCELQQVPCDWDTNCLPNCDRAGRRTSIAAQERHQLEAQFARVSRPGGDQLRLIADQLEMDKNTVRVWFCNQRQKQKRLKHAAESQAGSSQQLEADCQMNASSQQQDETSESRAFKKREQQQDQQAAHLSDCQEVSRLEA